MCGGIGEKLYGLSLGLYMEGNAKKWSNRQKTANYNDRDWDCMGKETQGRICGEIDEKL